MTLRVALDTNVVVSALLFRGGRLSWLRRSWQARELIPLVCNQTLAELRHVLAYPKFRLIEAEIHELLEDFLPYAETVSHIVHPMAGPQCRDQGDQMFIDLALAAGADALVTGDGDLLALSKESPVSIITPADLRRRLTTR